jgi:membrane-associated phospholipid phosphatase
MSDEAAVLNPSIAINPIAVPRREKSYWILCALSMGLFLLLAGAVSEGGMPYFPKEPEVTIALQSIPGSAFEWVMRGVSFPGDRAIWFGTLVALGCLCLLLCRARRAVITLLGIVLVGQFVKVGIKHLVARPRPTAEIVNVFTSASEVYSFPSGHTVLYTVFFGFLLYVTYTKVKSGALRWPLVVLLSVPLLTVAVSRVYLGAHWLSDTLGGYLLGGAILAAGIGMDRLWRATERGQRMKASAQTPILDGNQLAPVAANLNLIRQDGNQSGLHDGMLG